MDVSGRSSCSSVVSNAVANDAAEELRRIQALLASRGIPQRHVDQEWPHAATRTTQKPNTSPKRPAPMTQRPTMPHRQTLTPRQPTGAASTSMLSVGTTSSQTRTASSGSARRLQVKIQATLRSSKEMQSLLSRQYDLLEEANRQLKTLSMQQERQRV